MADAYKIDGQSARLIDRTVREVLGSGSGSAGRPFDPVRQAETCWGKLTTKVADGWEWLEQYPTIGTDDKLAWLAVTGGRKGDNTKADELKNLAAELVKGTAAAGSTVLLRRGNVKAKKASESEPDKWLPRWHVVAPIPAVARLICTTAPTDGSTCKAKVYSAGPVGDELTVQVVRSTMVGNIFYAVAVTPEVAGTGSFDYVQIGLPPTKSKGMVLTIMDDVAGLASVDWDYPKGH